MKVEVTVELDINLSKASITDIKKLLEEMMKIQRSKQNKITLKTNYEPNIQLLFN